MKKYFLGIACLGLASIVFMAQAQQNKQAKPAKKIVYKGKTFLNDGITGNGTITKANFDALLNKNLLSKDSNNILRPVNFFVFMYAERGLYEDSTGKLKIMTDNYSLQCDNGKLPEDWIKNIRQRSKAGDTAYFNNIRASFDSIGKYHFYSEPLKLIITD